MKAKCLVFLFLILSSWQTAGAAMEETIYLAGGCFWGVQEYFSRLPGVVSTQTGYANSRIANPDYRTVCSGSTNAAETVKVVYDPAKITLQEILDNFFAIIDPVALNRQGNDMGTQYRTGIYYTNPDQVEIIKQAYALEQGKYGYPLAVEVMPLNNFWPAEEYHQDYLKKNPGGYCHISLEQKPELKKTNNGSPKYELPDAATVAKNLSPQEYAVTQRGETDPPFQSRYWNNHEPGIYVDVVTGEPLFSSSDKFDSGTGWPSFSKEIAPDAVTGHFDSSHGMQRIEARSRIGRSHLGHIFPDGPRQSGGLRYCINGAALRFVPYEEMDKAGYGDLKHLVKK